MNEARTAIVTGGAQGIGKGIAARLLAGGWRVALADIDADAGMETTRELAATGRLLFVRTDDVDASWSLVTNVLESWDRGAACARCILDSYPAGSWGPRTAEKLLAADAREWRTPLSENHA